MKNKIRNHFNGNYKPFFEKYLSGKMFKGGKEGGYKALCPFHDDKDPSFMLAAATGLFHCFGCNAGGDIFAFYAKFKGLNVKSDFQKILNGIAGDFGIQKGGAGTGAVERSQRKKVIAEYVYNDPDGKPKHRVTRTESKDFYQNKYSNGQWVKGIKGIELFLYNLPEVIKSNEVIINEGEKDVETLRKLGFVGTTNDMGAGKWRDSYNKYLAGKDIILIPDNDDSGREHMLDVAKSLDGQVKSLKWLELPGLPEKGDVSNFVDTFEDQEVAAESLALLIENAEPYKIKTQPKFEDAILTTQDFKKLDLPERANFLSPWLKENSISLISGWRGVGKTFF